MDDRAVWTQLRSPVYSHGTEVTIFSTPVTGWESPWFKKQFVLDQLDRMHEEIHKLVGNNPELDEIIESFRKKFTFGFGASGSAFAWDDPLSETTE